jgi:hypothetical protein
VFSLATKGPHSPKVPKPGSKMAEFNWSFIAIFVQLLWYIKMGKKKFPKIYQN